MDSVKKIRDEVKRRAEYLRSVCEHGEATELESILSFIDSMQEEHDEIVDKYLYGKEPELVDADYLPKEGL